ncbi:putative fatty acyl-CoA reductase CG5065 isoform X2 [Halyomorpha halys]|uniref:putative fatty acyl-CoA reductase CG5065 isoform X2 n=1 Tax=Halyomorpha halys TaxID=286706 RepID=UPI0006D4FBD7|nr:putative fatty acyl-CoA reductase CG5065 [Halyomorpha halys]
MDNDTNNNSERTGSVEAFYRGGCILVTGGTGFVGKALVEKLLRSCPGIDTVYLLIRPKKGLTPQARLKELLDNVVFDRVRDAGLLNKVVGVVGDVMEPELGLSATDREILTRRVTVVFHSAATVKFNETLREAVKLNTMGTQAVIELCKHMVQLRAVIHVSTAYSNADKIEVEEKVYPPPASPEWIVSCLQQLSPEMMDHLAIALTQNHPNTYTVTKAMAETIVEQHAEELPIAIVRPSIVTAAWQEPFPGWVDNFAGITGIMCEIARGTIRSIICNDKYLVDIIPVDIVVDTLIVAAWHTATFRKGVVPVYNCTSGTLNPITWKQLGILTLKHSYSTPSKYVQWYPGFSFTTNRFIHNVKDVVLHSFPAFMMDVLLRIRGAKPIMLKLCKRIRFAAKSGEFFSLHEWKFYCDNQVTLNTDMSEDDRSVFHTEVSKIGWDDYVKLFLIGIRKYGLKDSLDSLPAAMKKLNRLLWLQRVGKLVTLYLIYKLVMRFR